jgi:hypothetical protein
MTTDTSIKKFGKGWRLVAGALGTVLLVALVLSAYVAYTVNAAYFPESCWPAVELYDVLWLAASGYLLFIGYAGRWRPRRT